MELVKVMNNNVAFAREKDGSELVVTGKGIGFGKKPGDVLEESRVERRYVLQEGLSATNEELLKGVDPEDLHIAEKVLEHASVLIRKDFPQQLLFELVDHMVFAEQRFLNGIAFSNALLWEIRHFYPQEFEAGKYALKLIQEEKHMEMPEDEAAFIAIHLVNAQSDSGMPIAEKAADILNYASKLIHYSFGIVLDEASLSYTRFVIHLKFCLERLFSDKMLSGEDQVFLDMIETRYARSFKTAKLLADYIKKKTLLPLTREETAYLTIHIQRIVS